jgi:perosamine synthetase
VVSRKPRALFESLKIAVVVTNTAHNISLELRSALNSLPFRHAEGLHTPELGELEKKYLNECIDSGYVSSVGAFVDEFENRICDFTGARFAVATSSGTTGLHLALMAAGVMNADLVVIPAITFVATANAVKHCGAEPWVLDVENSTMGLDPTLLSTFFSEETEVDSDGNRVHIKSGRRVAAVVAVHVLGHPCDIESIERICSESEVVLVEDAAESLGSLVGVRHTGRFGLCGVLSFNGNKTITTGGGGCVITDDENVAKIVRHLSTTARIPHPFEFDHDMVGYNYRMPNINAALGCAQMERLPGLISNQRALYDFYSTYFGGVSEVTVVAEPSGSSSNYWLQAFRLTSPSKSACDAILEFGQAIGLPLRPLWKPISLIQAYGVETRQTTPVALDLYHSVVCLPSSPSLFASVGRSKSSETGESDDV